MRTFFVFSRACVLGLTRGYRSIIGEDNALSIKVGAEAEDAISIRGASADVDRAVKEILQIVEDAQNEQIVNSYVSENIKF